MAWSRVRAVAVGSSLALALTLTGCGATDDTPSDFCKSADALTATVKQINQTSLTKQSIDAVQKSMAAIDTTVANLASSAEAEFSSEVDAVETAWKQLEKDVDTAIADPTSDHFYAARMSMSGLVTTVSDLGKAVSESC